MAFMKIQRVLIAGRSNAQALGLHLFPTILLIVSNWLGRVSTEIPLRAKLSPQYKP